MSLANLTIFSKTIEKQLLKCGQATAIAYTSRRSNSKSAEPPYKYVKSKIRVEGLHVIFSFFSLFVIATSIKVTLTKQLHQQSTTKAQYHLHVHLLHLFVCIFRR